MLTNKMDKRKIQFSVPEGYFDELQTRLEKIPSVQKAGQPVSRWNGIKPYVALAAAFAMILTAGTAVLKMTTEKVLDSSQVSDYEQMRMADLIPVTEPYLVYLKGDDESDISKADIAAYLIDSGTSLEHINYYEYENNR